MRPRSGLLATSRRTELKRAFFDSAGAGGALFPLGLAFGLLVSQAGLDWWWATIFTAIVYAGSLEFILVGLVVVAAPLSTIALTALVVNVRHVFYALSFPIHRVRSRPARFYSAYALTDEAYAITTGRPGENWTGTRIVGIQLLCQAYWVLGATIGALAGDRLGLHLPGLEFTLTALFVVLAIEAYRARRDMPTAIIALLSGLIALLLSPEHMLPIAMTLLTVGLLARFALRQRRRRGNAADATEHGGTR
ncbi:branched-chain amino acid ABC transporter permease [Mycetocola tolaasinivorans]|uniref:Branched-chain amino acid ABC transporter permease n=2 Tax=Mycetocola tolaasinivorans TaxID=76635 RepID=A0A3L7A8Z4_9MICO|nr:branched-chain amino acid ABC transporter permease [Mycetocola tolaasinivorans]